jgi:hypothetical protein
MEIATFGHIFAGEEVDERDRSKYRPRKSLQRPDTSVADHRGNHP